MRQPHQPFVNSNNTDIHRLWRGQWLEACGVVLLYTLLASIATYPAFKFLASHFIGNGDTLVNAWNLWWVQWTVSHRALPFHTTMLYHPDGVTLAYHTLNLFNGCLAFLFQSVLGMNLPATFNTISLLTFVASGLSMFVLVRSMTKSSTAGLVASLIFTFSPYRMGRVFFGNLDLYSTQFIPLLVLFLTRMSKTHQWRDVVGAAIALSLTSWCSLELGFGTGILILLLFTFDILHSKKQLMMRLKRWLLLVLLTCVFMSPFILPMFRNYQSFQDQTDQSSASVSNSADLLGFFIPDKATMPLVKRMGPRFISQEIDSIYAKFYGNPCEKTVFLGYSVLVMIFISLCVDRSNIVRRWLLVATTFFTLCLGPVMHIAGRPVLSPMPYELFFHLPLLKFGRSPSRLAIFLMLALAIIVGYGCAALERRWRRFKWVTVLIGALIFVEFLIIPMRLDNRAAAIPAYYDQLAREDHELAVLDVPIDLYGAQGPAANYMLYQTVHQKPIVGGYISRTPYELLWLFERPLLYQLRVRIYDDAKPYGFSPDVMARGLQDLHSINVQYIILHKNELSIENSQVVRTALVTLLSNPEYEDDIIAVWRLDAGVDPPRQ